MTFCKPHNRNSLLFANNLPQKHVFSLQNVSSCNDVYEHTHSAADKKNRETIAGFAEQSFKETFSINPYSMPQCGQGLHRSSHGC